MKVIYVVNIKEGVYNEPNVVDFHVVQVEEVLETEKEYITVDKIGFSDGITYYNNNFPKNLINKEFSTGYVTDKLDKIVLRYQIERLHNAVKDIYEKRYSTDNEIKEDCEDYYKKSINLLEKIVSVNTN